MNCHDLKRRRHRLARRAGQNWLTQARIAQALGISRATYQRYELGINLIPRWLTLAYEAMEARTERRLPADKAKLLVRGYGEEIYVTRLKGKILFKHRPVGTSVYWTLSESVPPRITGSILRLCQSVVGSERVRAAILAADDGNTITLKG